MRTLQGPYENWTVDGPGSAVAVGVFDGVHLGHAALVRSLRDASSSLETIVLTFSRHPDSVVSPGRRLRLLTLPNRRAELLEEAGADTIAYLEFDDRTRHMPPESFVEDVLVSALRAKLVAVGDDFRFGEGGSGNVSMLEELGDASGFRVMRVPLVGVDGPVTSTRIREMITAGDVAGAARLLGRPFSIGGLVVEGDGRGRTIGVPTANLDIDRDQLIPGAGVYAVRCSVDDRRLEGVVNIGVRPTFDLTELSVEVHLLDFDGDIYGSDLTMAFVERIRDEMKFSGPDELVARIHEDVRRGREILGRAT